MSQCALAMPPLKVAAAILRETTERLARECVQPSAEAPDWTEVEWAIACAAAAMQGLSMLLATRIAWSGPPFWQAFLAEQREQSRRRDAKIGTLLARLDDGLRAAGCHALALKGAAIRELDIYTPGERPMSDIDLLVAAEDVGPIGEVLRSLDYEHMYDTHRHLVFGPRNGSDPGGFAEHADHPLMIEVHTKISARLPLHEVDITQILRRDDVTAGIHTYSSTSSLLLHLLLHVAGNMCGHSARQIQFHDIALLASRMRESDWSAILEASDGRMRRWWLYPPLAITNRYYERTIPAEVLREARSGCPRVLRSWVDRRSLTDVSWSNLRLKAFPGIVWARTPLEVIAFARSRVWRSLAAILENEGALQHDERLRHIDWYRISRGRQILRWLLSPVPRAKAMWVLQAALQSVQEAKGA